MNAYKTLRKTYLIEESESVRNSQVFGLEKDLTGPIKVRQIEFSKVHHFIDEPQTVFNPQNSQTRTKYMLDPIKEFSTRKRKKMPYGKIIPQSYNRKQEDKSSQLIQFLSAYKQNQINNNLNTKPQKFSKIKQDEAVSKIIMDIHSKGHSVYVDFGEENTPNLVKELQQSPRQADFNQIRYSQIVEKADEFLEKEEMYAQMKRDVMFRYNISSETKEDAPKPLSTRAHSSEAATKFKENFGLNEISAEVKKNHLRRIYSSFTKQIPKQSTANQSFISQRDQDNSFFILENLKSKPSTDSSKQVLRKTLNLIQLNRIDEEKVTLSRDQSDSQLDILSQSLPADFSQFPSLQKQSKRVFLDQTSSSAKQIRGSKSHRGSLCSDKINLNSTDSGSLFGFVSIPRSASLTAGKHSKSLLSESGSSIFSSQKQEESNYYDVEIKQESTLSSEFRGSQKISPRTYFKQSPKPNSMIYEMPEGDKKNVQESQETQTKKQYHKSNLESVVLLLEKLKQKKDNFFGKQEKIQNEINEFKCQKVLQRQEEILKVFQQQNVAEFAKKKLKKEFGNILEMCSSPLRSPSSSHPSP